MEGSADLPAPKAKKKISPDEPERLVAMVLDCRQSYYISQYRSDGAPVGDEAILTIRGQIANANARHQKHVGREVEISLVCARNFDRDQGRAEGKPFLLYVNLRKNQRSLMAYLPADAFWSLPGLIASHADPCVELTFERLHYGSGSLLSLWLGSRNQLGSEIPLDEAPLVVSR